jgi:hypothetical protein
MDAFVFHKVLCATTAEACSRGAHTEVFVPREFKQALLHRWLFAALEVRTGNLL